jgi:FlaA1/EpsC-like NDP-sugar epimerase
MNFDSMTLSKILGRDEHNLNSILEDMCSFYKDKNILITGANGSLGHGIRDFLYSNKVICNVINTDILLYPQDKSWKYLDVTNFDNVDSIVSDDIDIIFHFAADKHAPKGELTPDTTIDINLNGTKNLINSIKNTKTKIVLASTCKCCNPETIYGSTKLIAERLILNSGHNVARFYNVVQSSDNVFEIWNNIEDPSKHKVMPCNRYFITIDEAVALTLFTGMSESGRYTISPGESRYMVDLHFDLYGVDGVAEFPRRGDRVAELRHSTSENIVNIDSYPFEKISSEHDASMQ